MPVDHKRLSAILITRDEEADLPACLDGLSFCDEIVVVDSGSTDRTVEIAKARHCRVELTNDWPGFGRQKQRALDLATGDWILSIDADERLSPFLATEIAAAITSGRADGFRINREPHYLGRRMRHGGMYPDKCVRLARRNTARFSADLVHEHLIVDGVVDDLKYPLVHFCYRSISEVLEKQRRYALLGAAMRREKGMRGGLGVALARSSFAFVRQYLLRGGILDGDRGLVAAIARAQETFWCYLSVGWDPPNED